MATNDFQPGDIVHDFYHDWIVGEEHSLDPRMVWATHVESGYRTLLLRTDLIPGPAPDDVCGDEGCACVAPPEPEPFTEAAWYALNDGWVR